MTSLHGIRSRIVSNSSQIPVLADVGGSSQTTHVQMTPQVVANTAHVVSSSDADGEMAPVPSNQTVYGTPTTSGLQQSTGRSSTGGATLAQTTPNATQRIASDLAQTSSAIHPHQAAYGAASPYINGLQNTSLVNNTLSQFKDPMNEDFVARATHYAHFEGDPANSQIQNYNAHAYSLNQLPADVVGNAAEFQKFMPSSWAQSDRSQLEALNNSYLHINDAAFEHSFITSPPTPVQHAVRPTDALYYNEMTGQYSNTKDPWFNVDDARDRGGRYYNEMTGQYSNTRDPWFNVRDGQEEDVEMTYDQRQRQQVNGASGGRGIVNTVVQTAETAYVGYKAVQRAGQGAMKTYQAGKYLYGALEGEEATALGESAIATAETAATSLGFEGAGVAAAEALGGAGIIGTGVATLGIGLLVGGAVVGGYEFATHYLGAPTLTQDEQYIGNGITSAYNAFGDLFN